MPTTAAPPGAAHEQQRASRSHALGGAARDSKGQRDVLAEDVVRLREVHVDESP